MTGEKNDFEIVLTDDLRIAVMTIKEAIQRSQVRALHDINRGVSRICARFMKNGNLL